MSASQEMLGQAQRERVDRDLRIDAQALRHDRAVGDVDALASLQVPVDHAAQPRRTERVESHHLQVGGARRGQIGRIQRSGALEDVVRAIERQDRVERGNSRSGLRLTAQRRNPPLLRTIVEFNPTALERDPVKPKRSLS